MSQLDHIDDIAYSSAFDINKIVHSGQIGVFFMGSPYEVDVPTGLTSSYLPLGIFSTDNGATWMDCGSTSDDSANNLEVILRSKSDGDLQIAFRILDGSGSASATVLYLLLAKPNQTELQAFSGTNERQFDDKFRYLKILTQDSYTLSTASDVTTTIEHGLGYVPMFNVFCKQSSEDGIHPMDGRVDSGLNFNVAWADSTNLYINTGSVSPAGTIAVHYFIFYEEQ